MDGAWSLDPEAKRLLDLSDYFHAAAEREVTFLLSQKHRSAEVFPAYFLFNHSLELFLKGVIGLRAGTLPWGHNLSKLLSDLHAHFSPAELQLPNNVINHLKLMQVVDLKNENHRYPHNDSGVTLPAQEFGRIVTEVRQWSEQLRASIA